MDSRRTAARLIVPLSYQPSVASATAYAPVNIALIKYWGKRTIPLHLPLTDSFSITIDAGTTTTVTQSTLSDTVSLNGTPLDPSSPFYLRLTTFLDLVRPHPAFRFAITTQNDIPTAAGLASSASGFAALVLALNRFFSWNLSTQQLSCLARLGSGSACRSIQAGFSHWKRGTRADGLDSYAEKVPAEWPELAFGILLLSSKQKTIGSSDAMRRTVDTSPLFPLWASCVERDLEQLLKSLEGNDFDLFGRTIEQNALTMHATMHASWPPIVYWQPETLSALHAIFKARADGLPLYATMDAGPNVKLFFQKNHTEEVVKLFLDIQLTKLTLH